MRKAPERRGCARANYAVRLEFVRSHRKKGRRRKTATPFSIYNREVCLLGLALLPQLLNLHPLRLDLMLLLLDLSLSLRVCVFLILHRVADYIAGTAAHTPPIAAPASGCPTAAPTIAPAPAPSAVPPRVPFSRVESGCPEHPATTSAPANAILAITPDFLRIKRISFITPIAIRNLGLFGFLLPLHLLNLLPLLFNFLLLLLHLSLGLLVRGFLILHRVADRESSQSA